jgi:hypothetical protein
LRAALRAAISRQSVAAPTVTSELYTVDRHPAEYRVRQRKAFAVSATSSCPTSLIRGLLRTVLRSHVRSRASDRHWVRRRRQRGLAATGRGHAFRRRSPASDSDCRRPLVEMLSALRVLSYWIAALRYVEPELLRLEPSLEAYESPFVAQNIGS